MALNRSTYRYQHRRPEIDEAHTRTAQLSDRFDCRGYRQLVQRAEYPNHVWSYDFVHDQTIDGRRLKFLTAVDGFYRAGLAVECGRSLMSVDVIRILAKLIQLHGQPAVPSQRQWARVHCRSRQILAGAQRHQTRQSLAECVHRKLQQHLSDDLFESMGVRSGLVTTAWLEEYNTIRRGPLTIEGVNQALVAYQALLPDVSNVLSQHTSLTQNL